MPKAKGMPLNELLAKFMKAKPAKPNTRVASYEEARKAAKR